MKTDSESSSKAEKSRSNADKGKALKQQEQEQRSSQIDLQELLSDLSASPWLIRYLPADTLEFLSEFIGNQRLQDILCGGGNTELISWDFSIEHEENAVNDISTEAPELVELAE